MSTKWELQMFDEKTGANLSTFVFGDFPSMRLKMVEHRSRAFRVRMPQHASQLEVASLLDLRGQGFKIERN